MASALIWSAESLEDIDAIAEFISRDSPYHAQRVVEGFFDLGDAIAKHPQAGRIVLELKASAVRERFLYSYRMILLKITETTHAGQGIGEHGFAFARRTGWYRTVCDIVHRRVLERPSR